MGAAGPLFGVIFYLLVLLAAISSAISLMEVVAAYFLDRAAAKGKQGNRKWVDELKVADVLKGAGYAQEDYTETKLLSPAAMDKALGKKRAAELLDGMTERTPGAPTVVPESDKRAPYDRLAEAQKEFA